MDLVREGTASPAVPGAPPGEKFRLFDPRRRRGGRDAASGPFDVRPWLLGARLRAQGPRGWQVDGRGFARLSHGVRIRDPSLPRDVLLGSRSAGIPGRLDPTEEGPRECRSLFPDLANGTTSP